MHQVFISYKESDRRLANDLAQGLEAAGYTTWNYDRDSRIGFNYMEYCGELIAQCKAMVLLISPMSVQSGQVTREVMRGSGLASGVGWDCGFRSSSRRNSQHCSEADAGFEEHGD
jgi:hypothetical protein